MTYTLTIEEAKKKLEELIPLLIGNEVIILTALVMMFGLIKHKKDETAIAGTTTHTTNKAI